MGVLAWFGTMFLWTLGSAAARAAWRVAVVQRRARRE